MTATRKPPREKLLEVAADLFYREGFRAVGVDTIVARAGVAKMSLYKHFPSKDDLVLEFLRRRDARWLDWFTSNVEARTANPRRRLLAVFDALAEWFASADFRGCAFLNAASEFPDPAHPVRRSVREHKARLRTYLAGLARKAGLPGADRLASQLALLVDGAIMTAVVNGGTDAAAHAKRAASALLDTRAPPRKT